MDIGKILGVVVTVVLTIALLALLMAPPVMLLWNWLCPELFGLQEINFWQALGLMTLSGLLFKSNGSSK